MPHTTSSLAAVHQPKHLDKVRQSLSSQPVRFERFPFAFTGGNNWTNDIAEDAEGRLWIGTGTHLSIFDPKTEQHFPVRHDPRDPDGLGLVAIKNFTVDDGLQSNEFNYHSFHKGHSGRLYFDGIWNGQGVAVRITITPPWWQTWWAYTLYGVVLLGILYSLRRYELHRVGLKNQLNIEQIEAEKFQDLDAMKSRFFANISHEFRTPLTLILGPIDSLLKAVEGSKAKQNLRMMRRHARHLLQLINQLLDINRFYQIETGSRRDFEGTGIGLSLAKDLVELHHGTIEIVSEEGWGTEAIVHLPLGRGHLQGEEIVETVVATTSEPAPLMPTEFDEEEVPQESDALAVVLDQAEEAKIVLAVEDNADMRSYIRQYLDDRYQVTEAQNGREGLEKGLAQKLKLSRTQLHRKISAFTNRPASLFLRTVRLHHARKMLEQNNLTVNEVPYRVGFSSHAYFSKCFREALGCTPREFVQSITKDL